MAKGDYVKVVYRTGAGTDSSEIVARVDGYQLSWAEPRDKDRFLTIEVQNRNTGVVETHLFASADVVAIISGHKSKAQLAGKPKVTRIRVTETDPGPLATETV